MANNDTKEVAREQLRKELETLKAPQGAEAAAELYSKAIEAREASLDECQKVNTDLLRRKITI